MNFSLGTQDKKKTIIAITLISIAAVLFGYEIYSNFFAGPSTPKAATTVTASTTAVTPTSTRTVSTTSVSVAPVSSNGTSAANATRSAQAANAAAAGSSSQNPELRLNLLVLTENTEYKGSGRNVFSAEAPPPPQVLKPIAPIRPGPVVPMGPPPPPPIDLQFYGYATSQGAKKRVFLKHGDDIFIAAEGEIVNHRYRVKSIAPNSVQIEDILNNNTQTIPLSNPVAG